MQDLIQILVSGLTLGAMYAVAAAGLSVVWGSLNLLNMAHGALLAVGGYAAYSASVGLGIHPLAAVIGALAFGAALGAFLQWLIVKRLLRKPAYEINVIVATVGVGFVVENLLLKVYGAYPLKQPLELWPDLQVSGVLIPSTSVVILAFGGVVLILVSALLDRTRMGRAIRAVAQSRDAARLMGVRVDLVYVSVMALAGALCAASGVMLSLVTTLSPGMGFDPMLKAFIVCVLAGLGQVRGSLITAVLVGLVEAAIQYGLGVRYALPLLLLLVIVALIWRPTGLFGRQEVVRL